jgi:hypothetical protein
VYSGINILSSPGGPVEAVPAALQPFVQQYSGSAASLRRAVGCSMFVTAVAAHALLDFASIARRLELHAAISADVVK